MSNIESPVKYIHFPVFDNCISCGGIYDASFSIDYQPLRKTFKEVTGIDVPNSTKFCTECELSLMEIENFRDKAFEVACKRKSAEGNSQVIKILVVRSNNDRRLIEKNIAGHKTLGDILAAELNLLSLSDVKCIEEPIQGVDFGVFIGPEYKNMTVAMLKTVALGGAAQPIDVGNFSNAHGLSSVMVCDGSGVVKSPEKFSGINEQLQEQINEEFDSFEGIISEEVESDYSSTLFADDESDDIDVGLEMASLATSSNEAGIDNALMERSVEIKPGCFDGYEFVNKSTATTLYPTDHEKLQTSDEKRYFTRYNDGNRSVKYLECVEAAKGKKYCAKRRTN